MMTMASSVTSAGPQFAAFPADSTALPPLPLNVVLNYLDDPLASLSPYGDLLSSAGSGEFGDDPLFAPVGAQDPSVGLLYPTATSASALPFAPSPVPVDYSSESSAGPSPPPRAAVRCAVSHPSSATDLLAGGYFSPVLDSESPVESPCSSPIPQPIVGSPLPTVLSTTTSVRSHPYAVTAQVSSLDDGRPRSNKKARAKPRRKAADAPSGNRKGCDFCATTTTPMWRRGPNGIATLCNACGLKFAKLQKSNAAAGGKAAKARSLSNLMSAGKSKQMQLQKEKEEKEQQERSRLADLPPSNSSAPSPDAPASAPLSVDYSGNSTLDHYTSTYSTSVADTLSSSGSQLMYWNP